MDEQPRFEIIEDEPPPPKNKRKRKPKPRPLFGTMRWPLTVAALAGGVGLLLIVAILLILQDSRGPTPVVYTLGSSPTPPPVFPHVAVPTRYPGVEPIMAMAWAGDDMVAAGSMTLRWYHNRQWQGDLAGYQPSVDAIALRPDGQEVAVIKQANLGGTTYYGAAVIRWDLAGQGAPLVLDAAASGDCASYFGAPSAAIAYSPDGSLLAAGGCSGVIEVWDTGSSEQRARMETGGIAVLTLAFSPDGGRLMAVVRYGYAMMGQIDRDEVQIWTIPAAGGQPALERNAAVGLTNVLDASFSTDGRYAIFASQSNVIQIWDMSAWTSAGVIPTGPLTIEDIMFIQDVALSEDGRLVAVALKGDGVSELLVLRWQQGETSRLVTETVVSRQDTLSNAELRFLHFRQEIDGQWLEYISTANNDLWRINLDRQLTEQVIFW